MPLPDDVEVPTYNIAGKSGKKLIVSKWERRTYLEIVDLNGNKTHCEVYFRDLEEAWNAVK